MYAITFDQTNVFNLKFTASNVDNNIDQAMSGIGYSNMIPITTLVQINAVIFTTDSVSNYIQASQLVIDEGTFATSPAQLKSIVAGTGMEVVSSTNEVTLNALASGSSYGTSLDTGSGPVVDLTWSTTKLIFSAEDFQATPDISQDTTFLSLKPPMHVGLTGNAQDISVLHLEPTMFEFATANQVALLSLKQSYIDALIDAKIQAELNNITFSSDFMVDRSVTGALSISHHSSYGGGGGHSGPTPVYEWPSSALVKFTGNATAASFVDISLTTPQIGSRLNVTLPENEFCIQFDIYIALSGHGLAPHFLSVTKSVNDPAYVFSLRDDGNPTTALIGGVPLVGVPCSSNIPRGQWVSVKFTFLNGVLKVFFDGDQKASTTGGLDFGTYGDEAVYLADISLLHDSAYPPDLLADYKNFKIFDTIPTTTVTY